MEQVLRVFPQAKWYQWEPVNRDNAMAAAQASFGQPMQTQFNFEKAKVVLSLDGDFLSGGFPGFHRNAQAVRRPPPSRAQAGDAALLRRREHADQHRRQGRSSLAAAGQRNRSFRAGTGGAAWRRRRRSSFPPNSRSLPPRWSRTCRPTADAPSSSPARTSRLPCTCWRTP